MVRIYKTTSGKPFTISKTYASVAALLADTAPTGILPGEYAIIDTGSVEDADNAKVYMWNGSVYTFVSDMSGSAGVTGASGDSFFTRTDSIISPVTSNDILDMGAGGYSSSVLDSDSAVGFKLNTTNTLSTDGSKLLSLQNNNIEFMHFRKGTDWWGTPNMNLIEFKKADGSDKLQLIPEYNEALLSKGYFQVYSCSDFTYSPGWADAGVWMQPLSASSGLDANRHDSYADVLYSMHLTVDTSNIITDVGPEAYFRGGRSTDSAEHYYWFGCHNTPGFNEAKNNMRMFVKIPTVGPGNAYPPYNRTVWGIDSTGAMVGASGPDGGAYNKWRFESIAQDSATAIGYELDTLNNLITSGSKHTSWQRNGYEIMSLNGLGNLATVGEVKGTSGHFGGATHYSSFESDGTLTFNGDATVWNDLTVPATSVRLSGATPPDFQNSPAFGGDSTLWYYTFNGAGTSPVEEVFFTVQLPHGYKEGTDIYPHVHFAPTSTNAGDTATRTVRFKLTYQWTNVDGTFGSSATINMDKSFVPNTSLWSSLIAGNVTGISGTGKNISSILMCRLFRDPGDASDDYPQDVAFLYFDIHYESDTVGSRVRNTKS